MSKFIFFDLETKPDIDLAIRLNYPSDDNIKTGNTKDPEKLAALIEEKKAKAMSKLAVDEKRHFAKVCVSGLLDEFTNEISIFQNLIEVIDFDVEDPDYKINIIFMPEEEIIGRTIKCLRDQTRRLCSFNGKAYDIPVLWHRAAVLGIKFNIFDLIELTKKYEDKKQRHTDLTNILAGNMDFNLDAFFGIPKTPIDFNTCSDEEMILHNIEDLINLRKLFQRVAYNESG